MQHSLPEEAVAASWTAFLTDQWTDHQDELHKLSSNQYDHSLVNRAKLHIKGLIAHNEDHAANKLNVYCPQLYYDLLCKTFNHATIFRKSPLKPTALP